MVKHKEIEKGHKNTHDTANANPGMADGVESKYQLQEILRARENEVEELRAALLKNFHKEKFYLPGKSREQFWKMINKVENSNERAQKMELEFKSQKRDLLMENADLKRQYEDKLLRIGELEKGVKKVEIIKKDNEKLNKKIEAHKKLVAAEQSTQLYDENDYQIYKEKTEYYETAFGKYERGLKTSMHSYEAKKDLLQKIIKMQEPNMNKKNAPKVANEMRATEIFYSMNSEYNIEQILLRFDTILVDSDKFVELLTLIDGFYRLVKDELDRLNEKN